MLAFDEKTLSLLKERAEKEERERRERIEKMEAMISPEPEDDDQTDEDVVPDAASNECRPSNPAHLIPWYTSGFE